MATVGTVVTKANIIDDFVSAVMVPEQTRTRWHATNRPTYIADVLVDASVGMANPTATDFTEAITASNIVSVLRDYAYQTTRVRLVRAGIYYEFPAGPGTIDEQVAYAHLNDTYLRTNPLSVSGPAVNDIITADPLNTFYTSLRLASNTDTYGDIIDLRICHSSCHSACHSSRGRR